MAEKLSKAMGIKKLYSISFGLFASLFLLWTLFNASSFVPEGQELKFTLVFLGYGILGSYVFAREDVRSKLSQVKFYMAIPIFLAVFFPVFFLLVFLFGSSDPLPSALFTALLGVPLYLQLLNSLMFSLVESSFFQGFLDEKIGILGSVITAGIFHMFIWDGSLIMNFLGSALLFFGFSMVYFYSKKSFGRVYALVIVIAVHSAYNFAKYKMIYGV